MKTEKFEAMLAGMERLTAGDRKELLARWRDLVEAQQGSEAMAAESKPAPDIPGPTVPLDERLDKIETRLGEIGNRLVSIHRGMGTMRERSDKIERVAQTQATQIVRHEHGKAAYNL